MNYHFQCGKFSLCQFYNVIENESINFVFIVAILRLPFEWRYPSIYLLIVVMQCIAVTYLFYLIAGLAAFGIGAYVFGLTATSEIKKSLILLDKLLKSKTDLQQLTKFISIFVHYHSLLKQLSYFWKIL